MKAISAETQDRQVQGNASLYRRTEALLAIRSDRLLTRVARLQTFRTGGAALEMALVLPPLILLLLGACDFGRFAHTQVAVANAARAGAAQASHSQPTATTRTQWEDKIRQAVREELSTLSGFESDRLSVTITSVSELGGTSYASVQVSYPFRMLVSWGTLPDWFTFREAVVFRIVEV